MVVCGFGSAINMPIATGLSSLTGRPLTTVGILGPAYAVLVGGARLVRYPPGDRESEARELPEQENNNSVERAWDFRTASNMWQWYALWAMFFLSTTAGPAIYADARAMKG